MAFTADHQPRRRRRQDLDDEIEEGEIVPAGYYDSGSESDTDDDIRYVFQPRDDVKSSPEIKRLRLEDIVAGRGDALAPSPTSSYGSDGTDSDDNAGGGAAAIARAWSFPCPVCRKEFGSKKAVHGHMRVHDPHGRHGQDKGKEKERPVVRGWAMTGKRGWIGGRCVSPDNEVDSSMAIVAADPDLSVADPMPMAFARGNLPGGNMLQGSSSSEPNPNESMAIVVASAANPSNQVVAHPPAAPQAFADQPADPQVVAHQPAAPPTAAVQGQQLAAAPAGEGGQLVKGFSCKECEKWFPTHQGLGGHVAGHKNRRKEAENGVHQGDSGGDAGAVACRGGAKAAKMHVCKDCGQVYETGVALGGHMRKHYKGKPIVPKKHDTNLCLYLAPPVQAAEAAPAAAAVEAPELALAIALPVQAAETSLEMAHPAPASVMEATQEEALEPAAATRSVRIFGVDIDIVQAVPATQGSSTVTTEGSASISNSTQ